MDLIIGGWQEQEKGKENNKKKISTQKQHPEQQATTQP